MNNRRLLAGFASVILLSECLCAQESKVVTLEDLFLSLESHSVQLRPALDAQIEAQREISLARSGRLPEISANLSLSYIGDGFTTKRDLSDYQRAPIPHFGSGFSVSVEQPIYTGGAITNSIHLAELKAQAAEMRKNLTRDQLRFRITSFYLDIYKYHNLKQVVAANIASAKKVLSQMKARYDQGTALLNDITRYELLVSNLELQETKINNTLEILNANLVTITGLPDSTIIEPDERMLDKAVEPHDLSWWQSEAGTNAPTLQLAAAEVNINRKAESLVKADMLPKIGLKAAWSTDGPILVEIPPINRNLSYWYVGLGVTYNISSLYKADKKLAKSRAAVTQAVSNSEALAENVEMDIRADYIKYLEAGEELKSRSKSVELAERNYNTVSVRYDEGMALITDMLDAADARLNSQQQLVNARIDIIYYYYKLLFTSGKI